MFVPQEDLAFIIKNSHGFESALLFFLLLDKQYEHLGGHECG